MAAAAGHRRDPLALLTGRVVKPANGSAKRDPPPVVRDTNDRVARTAAAAGPAKRFLLTMLWCSDTVVVERADRAGIDRIGLDLETLGKAERQRGLRTFVSTHRLEQLEGMRRALTHGELFCRVNPIHAGSRAEVERVLGYGVEVLMLPMFTTAGEVERFVDIVAGRAKVVPLLEQRLAADEVDRVVRIRGLDCLHVGLNDLAISLGERNRFALMVSPVLARIATAARCAGLRLCVGGIGRAMDDTLPIPSDLIYSRYAALGAIGALVSRSFFGHDPAAVDLDAEVARCRKRIAYWQQCSAVELDAAGRRFRERVAACQVW